MNSDEIINNLRNINNCLSKNPHMTNYREMRIECSKLLKKINELEQKEIEEMQAKCNHQIVIDRTVCDPCRTAYICKLCGIGR